MKKWEFSLFLLYLQLILIPICCIIISTINSETCIFLRLRDIKTKIAKGRLGKMLISLLLIAVPTILILAVLIPYINSRNKRIIDEISGLKAQLEQLDALSAPENIKTERKQTVPEIMEDSTKEKEEQDADQDIAETVDASEYNTGQSGKIYTKEELELLIRE